MARGKKIGIGIGIGIGVISEVEVVDSVTGESKRIKVDVYGLMARRLENRSVGIVDRFALTVMPGVSSEDIRDILREESRRGEKGGGTEPTGTRKTMRECMSRAQSLLWDGKL